MADGWRLAPTVAPAVHPARARTLQNATGLLLVGGWVSAFAAAQILIGGPMFYTILPDWSATDSLDNNGAPVPGSIIPSTVVLAWAAVGLVLAQGAIAAFMAYGSARKGDARKASRWGLAGSLLPPVNPVTLAGTALAWRASRASAWRTVGAPVQTPGTSNLLRGGGVTLLAGSAMSLAGVVAGALDAVMVALHDPVAATLLAGVGLGLGLVALFAASFVAGVLGWHHARHGRASAAAGWGLAAGLLPPMNPVTLVGALLCYGSPERQQERRGRRAPAAPQSP